MAETALNVLGTALEPCCFAPVTGFYRDGSCHTGPDDFGQHVVCAEMTTDFLAFSKDAGNDLSTPRPEYDFAGLQAGDRWCLCLSRWKEAYDQGKAPRVVLESTHEMALSLVTLEMLKEYQVV